MLNADAQPHHVGADARRLEFRFVQLAVGSAGRMGGERFRVADIDQAGDELQRVDEARARVHAALDAETEQAGGKPTEIALDERVVGTVRQTGIVHPGDLRMRLQIAGDAKGIFAVARHAQFKRFQTLQDEESVERADGRAGVAQRHDAGAGDEGGSAEMFAVIHAVVGRVGAGEDGEAFAFCPREAAAVNNGAANTVAMATDIFGQRFNDDIRPQLQRAAKCGRGDGVVNDERQTGGVRGGGKSGNIEDVNRRIADAVAINETGAGVAKAGDVFRMRRVNKAHFNTLQRQSVGKKIVSAAIKRAGGDDIVARADNRLDGISNRRHTARDRQCANAALNRGEALLQNGGSRVHDAGVNIAGDIEIKKIGAVLRIIEGIAGGLINGNGDGAGGRVGTVSGVNGKGSAVHGISFWFGGGGIMAWRNSIFTHNTQHL